jgi:hypothetical protein
MCSTFKFLAAAAVLTRVDENQEQLERKISYGPGDLQARAPVAGLDQFHVMGLEATEQLAQIAGIERGATILGAGSGLGGPSRYLASTYGCRVIGADLSNRRLRFPLTLRPSR